MQILYFKFAHRFRAMKPTLVAFSAIARNKTPQNLLPTKFLIILFSEMCKILYTQFFTHMVSYSSSKMVSQFRLALTIHCILTSCDTVGVA